MSAFRFRNRQEPSNRVEVVVTTTLVYHGGRAGRVHLSSHMWQLVSPLILATTSFFPRNSQFLDDPCPPKKLVCSGSILEGSEGCGLRWSFWNGPITHLRFILESTLNRLCPKVQFSFGSQCCSYREVPSGKGKWSQNKVGSKWKRCDLRATLEELKVRNCVQSLGDLKAERPLQ